MKSHHAVIYLLFFALAGALAVFGPRASHSAPVVVAESDVPPEALAALRAGRFLRASLILREYLAEQPDSTPATVLLAARAEAGWGDWERVRELLEGRTWLDGVAAGYGWSLLGRSQIALGRAREGAASLARYLEAADPAVDRSEQGITLLRRAEALAEAGRTADALAAYDDAVALLPHIRDWIDIFAASAAARAGDTATVRARLSTADPLLARDWAWRTEVRARRAAGDLAGAERAAERAAAQLATDARRAAAWTTVGSIREARRDHAGARAAYIRAMNAAQGSGAALEAARALSQMSGLSVTDRLLVGRVYLRHGNVDRGVSGIEAYLAAGLGTPAQREQLRYDVANAMFRGGDYSAAEQALLEVAATATDRRVAADALYTAARAQYRGGRQPLARQTLLRIIRDYSDQPAAVRAAYLSADLDHDDRALERATELYRQAIRLAPASEEAALARMRLGSMALVEGRNEDALREFDEYRATHRTGSRYQQATYWSAQALNRLGRTDEARARLTRALHADPFSYYGGLAAAELDQEAWGRLEHAPAVSESHYHQVERALARVDLLRAVDWNDAAAFEMERVRRHFARFDGALYTLAEALNERGFISAGIALGRDIRRREGAWNTRLLRIVYPFPFQNVIVAEARERGVDPFLAAALIRQESMFNPDARSPVGALGLMQVMPATGQSLARSLGVSRFQPAMLTNPELNVHFGMAYLADQLRTYGNRLDAVLAAYNAGPGRVTRWRTFPEYRDSLLFAERIPYEETRDYVRIVQNNRRIYAALYADLLAAGDDAAAVHE